MLRAHCENGQAGFAIVVFGVMFGAAIGDELWYTSVKGGGRLTKIVSLTLYRGRGTWHLTFTLLWIMFTVSSACGRGPEEA